MYQYYQPNKKDLKDKYGDCVIRAISKAMDCTWKEAFNYCLDFMLEEQCIVSSLTLELYKKLYGKFGFTYSGISNKKGSKRPTVKQFAKEHKAGTYILNVVHHQVAVVDGIYYDTWDSGWCCLYGYFEKLEEN